MGQLTGPTVNKAAADVCRDRAHHLEHEPEPGVLRAVDGPSGAIAAARNRQARRCTADLSLPVTFSDRRWWSVDHQIREIADIILTVV